MARNYQSNGYPSVTETISVLRKIGLEMWYKYNTAQFCDEKSKKGKEIGTQIHDVINQYIVNGDAKIESEYGEEVVNALHSFMKFKKDNPDIKLNISELSLTSNKYKFNGTIDCIGENIIFDWKTGECKKEESPKVYDEYKYQVSAYVYLYNETYNTNIEKAVIVSLAKDKVAYNKYDMCKEEIDSCFNEVFLSCLKIINYQKGKTNVT